MPSYPSNSVQLETGNWGVPFSVRIVQGSSSTACQRADWARHKAWCKKQAAIRELNLKAPGVRNLAMDFDAWLSAIGAMLYTWICVGALELSEHPENLHTKFVVLLLRARKPRPTEVLNMFEYLGLCVGDRAEYKLALQGRAAEEF
ncbi:hypothetical protein B0H19DRAFT_1253720 [Mycena capillaripes]|nr:hypothetical protein B0H19DRAFT_1253720 [Mycena capillaripes]